MVSIPQALQPLLDRAFATAIPAEANQAIARMRSEACPAQTAMSYEIVLASGDPMGELLQKAAPNLVYFLDCRGARFPEVAGVFISLFLGERLYFIHARDFLVELSQLSGLSFAQMKQAWGEGAPNPRPS